MCLIVASPNGNAPEDKLVRRAHRHNPHGWGIARVGTGGIEVRKGFRLKSLRKSLKWAEGAPFVLHFRFATHGAKDLGNCHPFQVKEDVWMAHNGIVQTKLLDTERSDTWNWVEHDLKPLVAEFPAWIYEKKEFADWIGRDIGWHNKMAFLYASGDIAIANEDMGIWDGELWFSNDFSHEDEKYGWGKWRRSWKREDSTGSVVICYLEPESRELAEIGMDVPDEEAGEGVEEEYVMSQWDRWQADEEEWNKVMRRSAIYRETEGDMAGEALRAVLAG
jgi:hypothetical protein